MDTIAIQRHFGLKRNPFGQLSRRREVYRPQKYREQLERIEEWVRAGEMCAALGQVGCGKTTMIGEFIERGLSSDDLDVIPIGHPNRESMSFITIYECIYEHYHHRGLVKCRLPATNQKRYLWLKELLGVQLRDRRVGIVIDESHRLPGSFLKGMKELTDLSFGVRGSLLGIVFVGHPYFAANVKRAAPDVYKRLIVAGKIIGDIGSMQVDEVYEYLRYRTGAAGSRKVFHRGAAEIIARCGETPLDYNNLAWQGMELAYFEGAKTVRGKQVLGGLSLSEKMSIVKNMKVTQGYIARRIGVADSTLSEAIRGKYDGDADGVLDKAGDYLDGLISGNEKVDDGAYDPAHKTAENHQARAAS